MKLTRCFHIYWNFLNSRFFLSFRVENVGLIIVNCEWITGVLWLERSSYKECSTLRQKIFICYLDLKKASEMLWHFSALFSSEYVCNREELRAAQELKQSPVFERKLLFKIRFENIVLKLKNVPLTKALEVWGHGESTGLGIFNPLLSSRLGYMERNNQASEYLRDCDTEQTMHNLASPHECTV